LKDALAIAHGTVWSFSPEMISIGPRWGWSFTTVASVPGLMFANAAWNRILPVPGTEYLS